MDLMEWALWVGILLFLSSISIGALNIYVGLLAQRKAEEWGDYIGNRDVQTNWHDGCYCDSERWK